MIYSCKGCVAPKRYPGCHAVCQEYLSQKAEHDRLKSIEMKKRDVEAGLAGQACEGIYKAKKIKRQMKGRNYGK